MLVKSLRDPELWPKEKKDDFFGKKIWKNSVLLVGFGIMLYQGDICVVAKWGPRILGSQTALEVLGIITYGDFVTTVHTKSRQVSTSLFSR